MAASGREYRIDFIDPLFAVAIHVGIIEGLMEEKWLHDRGLPQSVGDWAHLATFAAGGLALVLSWVGYHISIIDKPIQSDQRFFCDIILLLLYIFLLVYFREYAIYSFIILLIFITYIFWDYGKVREYIKQDYAGAFPDNRVSLRSYFTECVGTLYCRRNSSRLRREAVTCLWTLYFVPPCIWSLSPLGEYTWYGFALGLFEAIGLVLYRLDKKIEKQYKELCFHRFFLPLVALFSGLGVLPYFIIAR